VFIRHPEPQLKGCHSEPQLKKFHLLTPYPEPQLKGYILSHNSRNTNKLTFKVSPKHCRSGTSKASKASTSALSLDAAFEPPGEICFQTIWQGTRATRRQAPLYTLPLQVSPSGTTFTDRCHTFLLP